MSSKICAHCNFYGAGKKCGACRKIRYCSRICQQKDWVHHKKECGEWEGGVYLPDICNVDRALLRVIYTEFDRLGIEPNNDEMEMAIRRHQGYNSYDMWRYTKVIL